jgi:hypothetical protein
MSEGRCRGDGKRKWHENQLREPRSFSLRRTIFEWLSFTIHGNEYERGRISKYTVVRDDIFPSTL